MVSSINTGSAFHLACIATTLAFIVLLLGAWTRLADAGLGCPDWPGCYGQIVAPASPEDLARAERLYPDSPVEPFKAQVEMTHRYAAGLLGLVIFLIAGIGFYIKRQGEIYPVRLAIALVLLVILQAALGALTVILKLWPQVVVAHLVGGFLTFALLLVLTYRLSSRHSSLPLSTRGRFLGALMLILLLIQIMLGGWLSAQYAGIACPDLPTCQGQWWPEADWRSGFHLFAGSGDTHLGGMLDAQARVAIHLAHRLGAVLVTLYFFVAIWLLRRWGLGRGWAASLLWLISLQFLLGLANVFFSLPILVAVAHNGTAALLFALTFLLNSRLSRQDAVIS